MPWCKTQGLGLSKMQTGPRLEARLRILQRWASHVQVRLHICTITAPTASSSLPVAQKETLPPRPPPASPTRGNRPLAPRLIPLSNILVVNPSRRQITELSHWD